VLQASVSFDHDAGEVRCCCGCCHREITQEVTATFTEDATSHAAVAVPVAVDAAVVGCAVVIVIVSCVLQRRGNENKAKRADASRTRSNERERASTG